MNELLTYYSDFQRFGLNFYLNTPNSGGVGVVYARLRVGDYLSRFSLGLRCRVEYWDKTNGTIKLNRATMTKTDWEIYNAFSVVLNNIHNVVGEKLEYYICTPQLDKTTLEIGKELTDTINLNTKRMKKKKVKTPLISKLRGLVAEYDNKKSQSSLFGIVNTFARFLEVLGVEDIIENVNNDLMIKWREWLDIEKYSVARVKACVGVIFNLLAKLERKHGYDFKLNKTKLEPIRDKRSVEEKRDNGIALTFEEIEKIKNAPLDNAVAVIESKDKIWLEIARDMFLIQCFCGCRVEDLSLLLNSKHHTKEGEIYYSTFKTQKRGITSIIPLNTLFPDALELVQRYTDKCPLKYTS